MQAALFIFAKTSRLTGRSGPHRALLLSPVTNDRLETHGWYPTRAFVTAYCMRGRCWTDGF